MRECLPHVFFYKALLSIPIKWLKVLKKLRKKSYRKRWKTKSADCALQWRHLNYNNEITLKVGREESIYRNIFAGCASYGEINALIAAKTDKEILIGKYVSIGEDVLFILCSEHPYMGLSTYPYKVKNCNFPYEALSKGDIIIEDDVWIGARSIILSGLTIGKGAVVAAGSVVTKDVEPYSFVGGNPAKFIKYRFEPDVINKVKEFDFSLLTDDVIKNNIDDIYEPLTPDNADEILGKIKGVINVK